MMILLYTLLALGWAAVLIIGCVSFFDHILKR